METTISESELSKLSEGAFSDLLTKVHAEAQSRGYAVIIWNPEEIGDADAGRLEDISIERGWDYLGENAPDEEDEEDEEEETV